MNSVEEAKLLAELSRDESGRIDIKRVSSACDYVCAKENGAKKLSILRAYRAMIESSIKEATVTIESASELSAETLAKLKAFAVEKSGRSNLIFKSKITPSLIGGVRITCGDIIWERSARNSLESIM